MKKLLLSAIASFFFCNFLSAQTFNYSFSQSTGTYQPLTGGTTLINSNDWNGKQFKIPIGFQFDFLGKTFDSLTIATNGLILFGNDNRRAISTFKGIIPVTDPANNTSSISYAYAGNILKIEYKNCGFGIYSPDNFNFQVWLYQQGNKIEFHTGPTTLSAPLDSTGAGVSDSLIVPIVGILNPSMDKPTNGYLLTGHPLQPVPETIAGELKYLIRVPEENSVYTLLPQ